MLTIEGLRGFGADTETGLNRCMNNEKLYLALTAKTLQDPNFERLADAVEADDRRAAFEAAHALKGVTGNLSLTPLFDAASEMTELLRAGQEADYSALLGQLLRIRDEMRSM